VCIERERLAKTGSITNESLSHTLGITKLDRERIQYVRDKLGVQNTVREIQQYQQKWIQHLQGMDRTGYPSRHCVINRKGGEI